MGILIFLPIVAFEILRYPELPPFDESLVNDNLKNRPPYVNALTFEYQLKNYYLIMQHIKAFGNIALLGGFSGLFSACIYSTDSHKKFIYLSTTRNLTHLIVIQFFFLAVFLGLLQVL